ncbi:MAG: hypothetical protein K6G06_03995 [Butyrivibrio sp.]|nr:hypothetical protein [Butyrivibrio sp.]
MEKTRKRHILPIVLIVLEGILFLYPVLKNGLIYGYDYPFHLHRIAALADSLKNGIFPAKIHPISCNQYGYGVAFFYPDFFLYIPAGLILIGLPLENAVIIYFVLGFVICGSISYFAMEYFFGSRAQAMLGTSLLIGMPLVFHALYIYFSIGSYLAILFYPAAIVGLLIMILKDKKKYGAVIYAIGLCGAILSHSSSFIILLGGYC